MEIGKTLYVTNRCHWRSWLAKNHSVAHEIWLIYYRKDSGKPRIPYGDAVEEALCYGWIDSITKPIDEKRWAQRFSPRRKNSVLSEINKERVRRLIRSRKMTKVGIAILQHHMTSRSTTSGSPKLKRFAFPNDIIKELKATPVAWRHFQKFPESYKRIRIAWIDGARKRPEVFQQRLRYFIKMTVRNKRYGMVQ